MKSWSNCRKLPSDRRPSLICRFEIILPPGGSVRQFTLHSIGPWDLPATLLERSEPSADLAAVFAELLAEALPQGAFLGSNLKTVHVGDERKAEHKGIDVGQVQAPASSASSSPRYIGLRV